MKLKKAFSQKKTSIKKHCETISKIYESIIADNPQDLFNFPLQDLKTAKMTIVSNHIRYF